MTKVQRTSNFQASLPFFLPEKLEQHYEAFLSSNLGKIYQAIPWKKLTKTFQLREKTKGPTNTFPPQGKIALMLLKSYSGVSDSMLIEQINGNIYYQFLCGIRLKAGQQLTNYKIVSQIRCELAENLHIDSLQSVLARHWKPYMNSLSKVLIDATCYESDLRYPTPQKLLSESVFCLYKTVKKTCRSLGIKLPRTKYKKWKQRYVVYSRKRRKSRKERKTITRSLLKLLVKLDEFLDQIEKEYKLKPTKSFAKKRYTIKKIYAQQYVYFTTGIPPKHIIVSLDKPYLRPIVRGKEVKKVEFGAKVNKLQIDGINFIQHLNFEAFNEGTQFQKSIYKAQRLTRIKVKQAGADAIYATNANRKFATSNGIKTDFVRKGRAGKNEQQRKEIARKLRKERGSLLEGSFGNEKEHYHLKKIKARTKKTEILWIFFGIHTANAIQIGHRMQAARKYSRKAA